MTDPNDSKFWKACDEYRENFLEPEEDEEKELTQEDYEAHAWDSREK